MNNNLPQLRTIVDPRHPGVSEAVCMAFTEAAEVCLARHHEPPITEILIDCCGKTSERNLKWTQPNEIAIRAWNNCDDATRGRKGSCRACITDL